MTYDAFGNRWQQTATAGFAPQPEVSFTTTTNRIDGYCYDASGNVLDDGPCVIPHKYSYDAEGRLISGNYGATTYLYDADGFRVAKQSSGTTNNIYFYDVAGRLTAETNGSLSPTRTEIYGGNRHLATYQGANIYYLHTNWLGTEVARTDANGNLCETITSLPFGDAQQTSGTCSPTPSFFTGKERDTESGLDYFGARYYGSSMGRFSSPDPSGLYFADPTNPQSLNLYAYALNNPLRYTDPTGLYCFYGDPNNGNDNMDASQFDYHSSQSECTKPDENGNSGQWINDGATHYTADGYVDNDGRPDNYVINANVNSGPSTNPIQTAVSDFVSVLTTAGGAAADLTIGVSNQLTSLVGGKQLPYFRLFGTHFCGPGGGGSPNGGLDPACQAHDNCYATAGLSASSNGSGASLTLDQAAAAQGCNQALYDAARGHPNQLNGSAPLRQWLTKGDQVPFGHLAPGTEAKPW